MIQTLTLEMAYAAATDAGDRAMRRAGRTVWNEDDKNAAVDEVLRLWGQGVEL